jgi:diguanylate cyclase (GGDEF)-like protein/PAS domain S-box-containing protein
VLDTDGLISFASPASRRLLGIHESDLLGRHPFARVHPEDRFRASAMLDEAWAEPGIREPMEVRFLHDSGEWRWFEVLIESLLDQPEVGGVVIHCRDISDRRRAQEVITAREARFRALVQNAADLIAIIGEDERFTYVSPGSHTTLGYEPEELLGRSIRDIVNLDDLLVGGQVVTAFAEVPVRDAGGRWRDFELMLTDLRRNPDVAGIVLNARDVTDRKTLEGELRHLAMHDPLTGLVNRNLFKQRLDEALAAPGSSAILYLDIDGFKAVNDSLGHSHGDSVLRDIARRILSCLRINDVAARIGGDEFAILLHDVADQQVPLEIGERLLDELRRPFEVARSRVHLTASLGAAISSVDSTSETLMRDADVVMYVAKSGGKDRCRLFEPAMLEVYNERLELKRDLHTAIELNQLHLLYQPVYAIKTGQMLGVEALLRWTHPGRGPISPTQFIPLAEESGEILPIGRWVIKQAFSQLARWRAEGCDHSLTMSVNLSVRQLEQENLVDYIATVLMETGLEPSALILEVTESVLASDLQLVRQSLNELAALGVGLALDDFGTGYSSLGYLQHFQLDVLKIDRTFVVGAEDPEQQLGILRAIVDLADSRGMRTVAEGVEEEGQLTMLQSVGCGAVQGFLFGRPLPPNEVLDATDRARPYLGAGRRSDASLDGGAVQR